MNGPSSPLVRADQSQHRNVLICEPGRPFETIDIANMFDAGISSKAVGILDVQHWRLIDAGMTVVEDINKREDNSRALVRVFHSDVDPGTRTCQSCGKTCGTGRVPRKKR